MLKPLETMPQQNCKCCNALNILVTNRLAEHHLNAALLENGKVVIPFVPREGPGGPGPPLFFDQNEARRTEKKLFGDRPLSPPLTPPLSQGLDDRDPHLSEGLDPPLRCQTWKRSV